MQTQVTICNNTAVDGNNLKSKWNNHDKDFPKILKVLFFFNLRWIVLFLYFPSTKNTSQIWIQVSNFLKFFETW